MQMWQSLGHPGSELNYLGDSQQHPLLAKTDGNVNISAILVQARHNDLYERERSGGSPEEYADH